MAITEPEAVAREMSELMRRTKDCCVGSTAHLGSAYYTPRTTALRESFVEIHMPLPSGFEEFREQMDMPVLYKEGNRLWQLHVSEGSEMSLTRLR